MGERNRLFSLMYLCGAANPFSDSGSNERYLIPRLDSQIAPFYMYYERAPNNDRLDSVSPKERIFDKTTAEQYNMKDDEFEWDDTKATANYDKHGVSFEMARMVFKDAFSIDQLDDRFGYDEDRYRIIGIVENHLLVVSYTMRDEVTRIINARRAEPHERRQYYEENS